MTKVICLLLTLHVLFNVSYAQVNCDGNGTVAGIVVRSDGKPVQGAQVGVLTQDCVSVGVSPQATSMTDGTFELLNVPVGASDVYAWKTEEQYPDARFAIYANHAPAPRIMVTKGRVTTNVVVHLGAKAASISGVALDSDSLSPIFAARVVLQRVGDERIMYSTNVGRNGEFNILVPPSGTKFMVTAPGYQPWIYPATDGQSAGEVKTEAGKQIDIVAKLNRAK